MCDKYNKIQIKTEKEIFDVEYQIKKCDDNLYAVRLEKHSAVSGCETAESGPIFESRDKATEFLDLLIKNEVTPITLQDIIDDMYSLK